MDVVALLDALSAAGLSDVIQDAVAAAVGDAPEVSLGFLRGLLTGVGVGAAAAVRIVRQLVSAFGCLFMHTLLGLGANELSCVSRSFCGATGVLWCLDVSVCDELFSSPFWVSCGWLQSTPGSGSTATSPAAAEARRRAEEDAAAAAAALARARELEAQAELMRAEVEAARKVAAEAEAARKAAAEAEAARKATTEAEAARRAVSCAKGLKGEARAVK